MTGMEMMIAKLIGLSPEQLKTMAGDFVETVSQINKRLENMERMITVMHELTSPEPLEKEEQ